MWRRARATEMSDRTMADAAHAVWLRTQRAADRAGSARRAVTEVAHHLATGPSATCRGGARRLAGRCRRVTAHVPRRAVLRTIAVERGPTFAEASLRVEAIGLAGSGWECTTTVTWQRASHRCAASDGANLAAVRTAVRTAATRDQDNRACAKQIERAPPIRPHRFAYTTNAGARSTTYVAL
jgi:hypothetical protein